MSREATLLENSSRWSISFKHDGVHPLYIRVISYQPGFASLQHRPTDTFAGETGYNIEGNHGAIAVKVVAEDTDGRILSLRN